MCYVCYVVRFFVNLLTLWQTFATIYGIAVSSVDDLDVQTLQHLYDGGSTIEIRHRTTDVDGTSVKSVTSLSSHGSDKLLRIQPTVTNGQAVAVSAWSPSGSGCTTPKEYTFAE